MGTTILPARVRAPDDKAKAENAVRLVKQLVLAPLRDRQFFSLAELNQAIGDGLARLNAKPFTKRDGSRDRLLVEERAQLRPLPTTTYSYGRWRQAKVNVDYHIEIDQRLYSVPYRLIRQHVDAGVTQVDLSVALGRSQSFVSDIERGVRRLDVIELRDVCHFIGTDLHQLLLRMEAEVVKQDQTTRPRRSAKRQIKPRR